MALWRSVVLIGSVVCAMAADSADSTNVVSSSAGGSDGGAAAPAAAATTVRLEGIREGATREALEQAAKNKIALGMAEGIQNNVELRLMLANKFVKTGDYASAIEQHEHIVRIQKAKHGENSAEASTALEALGFLLVTRAHAEL